MAFLVLNIPSTHISTIFNGFVELRAKYFVFCRKVILAPKISMGILILAWVVWYSGMVGRRPFIFYVHIGGGVDAYTVEISPHAFPYIWQMTFGTVFFLSPLWGPKVGGKNTSISRKFSSQAGADTRDLKYWA